MGAWSYQVKNWSHLARISQFSSGRLAGFCGVSQRQLQRHFHDVFGLELREWLKGLRLKDARHLLDSRKPVKEVAFLLGFKTSNHFSREFKKVHGITPEKFARANSMTNPQVETEYLELLQASRAAEMSNVSRLDTRCHV
jgi:AraC-like DNA-binding protein